MYLQLVEPIMFAKFQKIASYESPNKNIQRVIAYIDPINELPVIAVLYEGQGAWGELIGSTIEFHTFKDPEEFELGMPWEEMFDIKEIQVGYSANDIVLVNINEHPYIFVVSSGDNRIYIVDGVTQEVNGSALGIDSNYIQIPCEFPNQLREVSFKIHSGDIGINNCLALTTTSYDGNVYYLNDIFTSTDFNDPNSYNMIIPSEEIAEASYLFRPLGEVFFARTLTYTDADWFNPNDEVEIFYCGSTNILELNNTLKVFPNPVENIVNIELEEATNINSIRLFDNEGKYIQALNNYSVVGNIIQINIPKLPAETYFIMLDTKQGIHLQKIIKK